MAAPPRLIRLLERDPDLGGRLSSEVFAALRNDLVVATEHVYRGPLLVAANTDQAGFLGMLVLDGYVFARYSMSDRIHLEVLGPGDFMRPALEEGPMMSFARTIDWSVPDTLELAVLDREFAQRAARWPELLAAVVYRGTLRARTLNFLMAATAVRRIDERLLVVLWSIAERWGRVTPEGVTVNVPLTHSAIAQIIGAERPSVTLALNELRRRGVVRPLPNRHWLLCGEAPQTLRALRERTGPERS